MVATFQALNAEFHLKLATPLQRPPPHLPTRKAGFSKINLQLTNEIFAFSITGNFRSTLIEFIQANNFTLPFLSAYKLKCQKFRDGCPIICSSSLSPK